MPEQELQEQLRTWRRAHPQATFDEIDAEVVRRYAAAEAAMVAELSALAPPPDGPESAPEAVHCPQCQALSRRGKPSR